MKLAFSTIGCPNFSWTDLYSMAKDLGFDGIEVRGLGNEIFPARAHPFTAAQIPQTVKKLADLHLEIPCLSSACCLKFADKAEEIYQELVQYIELAAKLSTPYVRVLGDLGPQPTGDVDDSVVLDALKRLIPIAEEKHVTLLVETNGVYADTARLGQLLNQAASDAVSALWDIHHPYRFAGETPEQTVQNLGAYVKYVHIKDSVVESGTIHYRVMGEGDLPIDSILWALNSINYDGYLSLEWINRWAADLDDAGVIFSNFINYMSGFTGKYTAKSRLFDNNAQTGKYVWEKDTLIDLTFPQVLDRMVTEFPDQYAFRYTTMDYTRTYAEFRDDVDTFARSLIALGVKPGDHVAIWATNIPQWFITFWATTKIGAVLITVNTAYKIYEAEYLLRQSDTHTLVMIDGYKDSNYVAIIKELCPELETAETDKPLHIKRLPFLRNIITVDSRQKGCLTWQDALSMANKIPLEEVYRRERSLNKHDVCNMQYTSGTTGFPKGVMLTHYNVVNNGKNIGDCMDLSTADRMLIHVPMFHCFGMVLAMTAAMTHGVTMSPLPYFSPKLSLACINQEKITCFHGVPTMFIAMMEHQDFPQTDFSSMRTGIMAGSPCPTKVMQDVVEKMNMTEITIVFGQTESAPGCTQSRVDDSIALRVTTVGRPLPGVECKIVDPETGKDLPDNVDGEFLARGYNIMKGYYKMPEATAAAIDRDGWLHTGDLARRSEDGCYKITGRIKDMIIRGGENIYPKEIEDFIYTHPQVKDVQVIGVPDKQYGEEIMACVILKEGAALTAEELKDYIRSHIAKHKTPHYIDFVTEFPMNAAGKIMKYKMREQAVIKLGLQADNQIETA
ncbi:AMP-binding protein [Sporomusa acidovorans]|uniref:2-succinylbenzoate--CoA ligase n=1 Tax=Sporomusa acidovorans (strain ATCC 49682 / DSM 3132 / Mol) TaxID=1123286 RepID=A0ABZ3J6Z9_SPOA4|nr:AMP-binding protein [Sporomusa acidovorans]OZC24300.1 long-chain-fatty-acid--CoA ligase [Sporomusa acidovorans DSM 3132]SDF02613.1 fatty-acyl-CoA synthase [Sporomusa acidovorans]